ncbi:unnamed protein product [Cylicocyclus nassatus]|uniref:Uncharacterized protein n=1 Tax=Cylicocyclus nassatus TaxID=53992 RepID=A0AA36GK17_CYLNA|nr:unnamed protein product [Cylicocyclus nassatus]
MSFYDFYNVQMLQAMQQFYATSDLNSQQTLLGPQQLFTSNNTNTPNELYLQNSDLYVENSESNNEAVALQAPGAANAHKRTVDPNNIPEDLRMWCKWGMQDYETTNAAETFHNKLCGMLSKRINPPFEELLECLHSINSLALEMLMSKRMHALRELFAIKIKSVVTRAITQTMSLKKCFV